MPVESGPFRPDPHPARQPTTTTTATQPTTTPTHTTDRTELMKLATFEGSDGNGYYGTGYTITVKPRPT